MGCMVDVCVQDNWDQQSQTDLDQVLPFNQQPSRRDSNTELIVWRCVCVCVRTRALVLCPSTHELEVGGLPCLVLAVPGVPRSLTRDSVTFSQKQTCPCSERGGLACGRGQLVNDL